MMKPRRARPALARLIAREDGGVTILAMYILCASLLASAFAVDFAYLQSARTQLQIAADSAAHAALYYRERNPAEAAREKAIEVASHDMPDAGYGVVLRPQDIQFGYWDHAARQFTPDETSVSAVRVRPSRASETGNPVVAHLFNLLDHKFWDIQTEAVFVTFQPPCMREGFVADGMVDLQSNNGFTNGFCVHSNSYVSLNSNNFFEQGTIVSMPDLSQLDLPKSGFKTNEGLQVALRRGYYRLRVLRRVTDIRDELDWGVGDAIPDYIQNTIAVTVTGSKFNAETLMQDRINRIVCSGGKATIEAGSHLRNLVITTDCQISFGQGVLLENVLIFTSSDDPKSFTAPSGLQIGLDDGCAAGGGAQLVTMGGLDVASDLRLFGGQIIALGDIAFAANANGIQGASMIAGGTISGTSNMDMGFCGTGMEQNFESDYFRLAL